jgi:hypothetical protein
MVNALDKMASLLVTLGRRPIRPHMAGDTDVFQTFRRSLLFPSSGEGTTKFYNSILAAQIHISVGISPFGLTQYRHREARPTFKFTK